MEWLDLCKQYIPEIQATYLKRMGKPLNLDNPQTFTEKMQWLKIYDSTFLKTYCTDKITVHRYCAAKLGRDIFIPILRVFDNTEQINLDNLPNGIVFKCNHGSGYNIICRPNESINIVSVKSKLSKWLNEDFSTRNGVELHYKLIPRKILIEPYMNDGHLDLVDYKFYCINGTPIFCQVISDRNTHETISHYTDGWKYAPQYDWVEYDSLPNIPRPDFYTEMLSIASRIAADFKLVRVDFYVIANTLYLGELTFTPNSGFHHFKQPSIDIELGNMLKL
jgi:hypothetical protein